ANARRGEETGLDGGGRRPRSGQLEGVRHQDVVGPVEAFGVVGLSGPSYVMPGGDRLALREGDGVGQRRRPEGVLPDGRVVELAEDVVVDQTGAADEDLRVVVLLGQAVAEEDRRDGVSV